MDCLQDSVSNASVTAPGADLPATGIFTLVSLLQKYADLSSQSEEFVRGAVVQILSRYIGEDLLTDDGYGRHQLVMG